MCWTCSLALPSSTLRFVPTARIYPFRSFSPCSSISIHHLHPSCLVSALLSTGYGPRRNAIDDFSRQPPLLSQPPSSRNQLEPYLILLPSDFEVFILYLRPTSTLAHRFPSALSNFSSQQYLESQEARNPIACRRPVNRNPIVNRHPAIPCTSFSVLFSTFTTIRSLFIVAVNFTVSSSHTRYSPASPAGSVAELFSRSRHLASHPYDCRKSASSQSVTLCPPPSLSQHLRLSVVF